jgi:hypothetical protein
MEMLLRGKKVLVLESGPLFSQVNHPGDADHKAFRVLNTELKAPKPKKQNLVTSAL